jgi:hypothetical protein
MRPCRAIGVLLLVGYLAYPSVAAAQFWPRYDGGWGGGYYGGWGGFGARGAAVIGAREQDRTMGQQAAMAQSAMVQSGIRNTLQSQAQSQTQSIANQQQATRDWWFQEQQRQLSQRQAASARTSVAMAAAPGFESAPAAPAAEFATDVIKWPALLGAPQFAEQRAIIEAPYRRNPPANPTATDYQNMVEAAGQMKTILGSMAADISAQQYIDTEAYLNQLIAEARQRLPKDSGTPESSGK